MYCFCRFVLTFVVTRPKLAFDHRIQSRNVRHSSSIITQGPKLASNSQQMCQTRLQLNTLIPNRRNSNQMSLKLVPIANEMSSHALYFLKRVSNHLSQLQLISNDPQIPQRVSIRLQTCPQMPHSPSRVDRKW